MTVEANDYPIVATYWLEPGIEVPQYQLVWHDGTKWPKPTWRSVSEPFGLAAVAPIPISRPQVVAGKDSVFRDEERGNGISVATSNDRAHQRWTVTDLLKDRFGAWEHTLNGNLWTQKGNSACSSEE